MVISNKNFEFNADESGDLANVRGQFIEFYHIPSGESVRFKAFLTQFSDQYQSDWNDESVFGRMDPISTFKGTRRVISLGWDVVAGDIEEAEDNLKKCSLLLSMLYPSYEQERGGATSISTSPLFRLKFMNLIQNAKQGNNGETAEVSGLLGKVGGFTYEPNIEHGFFDPIDYESTENADDATISAPNFKGGTTLIKIYRNHLYPQTINLNCEFTVIHEHELGWNSQEGDTQREGFERFPYSEGKDVSPARSTNKSNETSTRNDQKKKATKNVTLKSNNGGNR